MIDDVLKTKIADPNPIPPMKSSLDTVLRKILARAPSSSGTIFIIRRDEIEITTRALWLRELGLPADTKSPLVVKHFRKTPLHKALAATSGNILIDVREERKTRVKVTARFDHVPIETALELLADMAGLAVVKKANVYYVTSPSNAERLRKDNPPRHFCARRQGAV